MFPSNFLVTKDFQIKFKQGDVIPKIEPLEELVWTDKRPQTMKIKGYTT